MSEEVAGGQFSRIQDLTSFLKNMSELMDRLDQIQQSIGPFEYPSTISGTKEALLKLFEACCPLNRSQTEKQLWDEHCKIRELLHNENIPRKTTVYDTLVDKDRQKSIEKLYEYLESNNNNISNVKFTQSNDGFNLIATQNIDSDTKVFEINKSMTLDSEFFQKSPSLKYLAYNDPVLSTMPSVLLTCSLLFEFYSGADSPFSLYIDSLPIHFGCAYYFDLDEMSLLKGSVSFRDALGLWKSVVRQYSYFHLKIIETLESGDESVKESLCKYDLPNKFCYEDFRWACAVVSSRSISLPISSSSTFTLCLIPIGDLCDHGEYMTNLGYDIQSGNIYFNTLQSIEKDKGVFLHYGAKTNSQFLYTYGFIPEENHNDFVLLRFPLPENDPFKDQKHSLLVKAGMSEFTGIPIGFKTKHQWSGDVMAYSRIYAADHNDLDMLSKLSEDAFRKRVKDSVPLSKSNEENAKKMLVDKLTDTIKSYNQSLEENESVVQEELATNKMKMIVKLKKLELAIIQKARQDIQDDTGSTHTFKSK